VILVTLAEIGRRWTPAELNKEREVCQHCTIEWVDAWVKSGLIDQVTSEIGNLLTAHTITARDLMLRMPAWYQRLGEKLLEILPQWLNVIPAAEQQLLKGWLHNRGLQVVDRSAMGAFQSIRKHKTKRWEPPLIDPDAVHFVREATAQTAKPLNGLARSQPPTNDGPENN